MNDDRPYIEPGYTKETRAEIMAEIDRQIEHERNVALGKHHAALMGIIDEMFENIQRRPTDTWLVRQLKNMRVDMQLSGNDHYDNVLSQAILELGGEL